MASYKAFESLLKENNVTPYRVAKDLGFNNVSLTDWKYGRCSPNTEKLIKIAGYFNVSINYLIGTDE